MKEGAGSPYRSRNLIHLRDYPGDRANRIHCPSRVLLDGRDLLAQKPSAVTLIPSM